MKTLITPVAALTLLTASSATAQAEGSQFEKSTSINATDNTLKEYPVDRQHHFGQ